MGLIDDMMGDALESIEPEGLDSEADVEVDRIVAELTADILAPAGAAPSRAILKPAASAATEVSELSFFYLTFEITIFFGNRIRR
jgi:hypothetical protein